jgi:hypothetical protein
MRALSIRAWDGYVGRMSLVDDASDLEFRLINPAKNACPIDRGTMCRWVEDAGAICRATVVHAMRSDALSASVACVNSSAVHSVCEREPVCRRGEQARLRSLEEDVLEEEGGIAVEDAASFLEGAASDAGDLASEKARAMWPRSAPAAMHAAVDDHG